MFAHSLNARGERHLLTEHLHAVAALAASFAAPLGSEMLAFYSGLWHDLGKFHPDFQAYLLRSEANPRAKGLGPDHKAAGAHMATNVGNPLAAMLIQGHHGGLPRMSGHSAWLKDKLASGAAQEALAIARQALDDLDPSERYSAPEAIAKDRLASEMFLRLAFSALVDADFLDTEWHFNADRSEVRGSEIDFGTLWRRFEQSQTSLVLGPSTPVNDVRNAIYAHCLVAAEQEPGLFRLTVPTGGGKTRSAMAFALRHALRHGHRRVVVAVPFISITEQTAAEYRDIFQEDADDNRIVLEHHSMADVDEDEEGDFHTEAHWSRLAAENWDAPIIVTTTVQLFESLFGNRTSHVRKLHRLAESVIILDEAQSLPPHLLKPILDALRQLVEHYGATVVISTATQPAFDTIPLFRDLPATEIVPEPGQYFEALRRVEYEWRTDEAMSWPAVAAEMAREAQALAVVNTRADAMSLLDALDDPAALHLSTLLCGAHRRDVIAEIKARLLVGETCRVVSTQVIEAGVDLDFPFVLRAMGPLDSIIQAAGRCNREGKLAPEHGRVLVFVPEGGGLPQGSYRTGTDLTRSLLNQGYIDPDAPEASRHYFTRLFESIDTDRDRIQALREAFDYPETAVRFRMIDDDNESVVVTRYGSDAQRGRVMAALDELRRGTARGRQLRRVLQPFMVNIRRREAARLRSQGLIVDIAPGIGEWAGEYDAVRGIVLGDLAPDLLVV